MEGGALLGAGTFGCVFDPAIRCSVKPELATGDDVVGKLGDKRDVVNEANASKILSGVEHSREYFSLANINSLCKYDDLQKTEEEMQEINKCKIQCETIRKSGTSQMIHYTMPFGGLTIEKYTSGIMKTVKEKISPMKIIVHFLEACAIMTLNNIIHYDLHPGNILFDEKTQLPRIIDFGLSFTPEMISLPYLNQSWKSYNPVHPYEPPEITVITGMNKGLSFDTAFQQVLYKKLSLKDAQAILGLSLTKQGDSFQDFWENSASAQKKDWPSFFKFYWPGFDAWGAGIVLLNLYVNFEGDPNYINSVSWKEERIFVKALLRGLYQMSPIRRLDCVEALANVDPDNRVLLSASGKAWLQEKEKMRSAAP